MEGHVRNGMRGGSSAGEPSARQPEEAPAGDAPASTGHALTRALFWILSIFLCSCSLVYLADEYTRLDTMVRMGDIWSMLDLDRQPLGVFSEVDQQDFLTRPLPAPADTLLTIDGIPATHESYFERFNPSTPAGLEVPVTFTHEGRVVEGTVRTRSIPGILRVQFVLLFCLRVGIALSMLFTGVWAFARRPFSSQVRVLSLFCFSLVAITVLGQPIINPAYSRFQVPFRGLLNSFFAGFGLLSASFWVHLQMIFPHARQRYLRHRAASLALIYSLAPAFLVVRILGPALLTPPLVFLCFAYFAGGYFLLGRSVRNALSHLERRQARLVLVGSVPGVGLLGLVSAVQALDPAFRSEIGIRFSLALTNLVSLALLLTPVTILYAFGRYRLLEIEARVRRGTLFVAVNAVLLAVLGGLVYFVGWLLMRAVGTLSTTPMVVASLGLALGVGPAQRRIRGALEDRIYPERRRLRGLLKDFLAASREIADETALMSMLDERLRDGLGTSSVCAVLPSESGTHVFVQEGGTPRAAPFRSGDGFIMRICEGGRPLLLDEVLASGRFELEPGQEAWLQREEITLIIPLPCHSGAPGFLAAGPKRSGDDYSPVELEMLGSLSAQVAVTIESIRLFHEKMEKDRLQQQLTIARRIQEGLLPRELPDTPGLSIACRIIFCLDVAGDFYDVIRLEGGRTLVTAGDVSGKGMGPALLMANLQASLRAMSTLTLPLSDEIARLNDLLCDSTPDDFFVTLFVMVFDPGEGTLRWVNAGHNPPLLLRSDGCVTGLADGGLVLGVRRGASYQEGVGRLREGDSILLYTDGVSEAMDGSGEEFGETRMEEFLRRTSGLAPDDAVGILERELRSHHGAADFEDDVTIVLCRRVLAAPDAGGTLT